MKLKTLNISETFNKTELSFITGGRIGASDSKRHDTGPTNSGREDVWMPPNA